MPHVLYHRCSLICRLSLSPCNADLRWCVINIRSGRSSFSAEALPCARAAWVSISEQLPAFSPRSSPTCLETPCGRGRVEWHGLACRTCRPARQLDARPLCCGNRLGQCGSDDGWDRFEKTHPSTSLRTGLSKHGLDGAPAAAAFVRSTADEIARPAS